jgi:hypothetical protein
MRLTQTQTVGGVTFTRSAELPDHSDVPATLVLWLNFGEPEPEPDAEGLRTAAQRVLARWAAHRPDSAGSFVRMDAAMAELRAAVAP